MSHFYQIFPGTIVKKAWFPSRLTLSTKCFSRENFHFHCFFEILVEKLRQGCQNKSLRWQNNSWGKWFFFKGFDFWYCYLTLNKIFWILSENYKQGCQNCILCVEMNKFRKNIFFWKKLSVSISFRLLRKKNLDIQREKCQDCPNWIWSVRWQNLKKKCIFLV